MVILFQAESRIDIAGECLTKYIMDYLHCSYEKSPASKKEILKDIKEKACYVAFDFEKELNKIEPFDYELPDGTHVFIKEERIRCPEALFKPYIVGEEGGGIAQVCNDSIKKCDIDIREELYNNIVLSGGNSMFKGLRERLTKEIKALIPSMKEVIEVIASADRNYATWIGGSLLSCLPQFESMLITKKEYEEYGATIVHRKCF